MRVGIYFGGSRPQAGGAHTFLVDLLQEIAHRAAVSEHQFTVFCHPGSSDGIRLAVNAPNIAVASVARPSRALLWMKFSLMRILKFSPLARSIRRWRGPLERAARRRGIQMMWFVGSVEYECPDIPYVATMLDLQHRLQPFFPEVGSRAAWDAREQFFSYSLRRAAYCVTGTEEGKRQIESLYQVPASRIRVLPLPVPAFAREAGPSAIDVRTRFGIAGDYVFYPAQFWAHKNHINLILALQWLRERENLRIALVLTGSDHGNLAFIKRFVQEQGLAEQVHFLGFVSEEELVALYRQALALAFVTYFGPDNIPPLEAFALGCPVVASAVPGSQEQLGDCVIPIQPSDPEDIARAIWRLHSDDALRAQMARAGVERAGKWTASHYIQAMFDLFDEFSRARRNWE